MKQPQYSRFVLLLTCTTLLLLSILSANTIANEVYTWTDADGVVHYGDKAPRGQEAQTITIRESSRLNTTVDDSADGDTQPDTVSAAENTDDSDAQESIPEQSIADAKREEIAKSRMERREKKAEMDRTCAKHSERLASIEPNRRVFYEDESGETVRMDDQERVDLIEESKDFIAENCQ